jgi:hypothetical protein
MITGFVEKYFFVERLANCSVFVALERMIDVVTLRLDFGF